jgi:hypothetical protein
LKCFPIVMGEYNHEYLLDKSFIVYESGESNLSAMYLLSLVLVM